MSIINKMAKGLIEGTWVCSGNFDNGDLEKLEKHFPEVFDYTLRQVLEMERTGTVCVCRHKGGGKIYELNKREWGEVQGLVEAGAKPAKKVRKTRRRKVRTHEQQRKS